MHTLDVTECRYVNRIVLVGLGMLKPSSGCIYMVYEAKSHKTVWIKFMNRLRCQFLPFLSLSYSLIAY
jgi:hypothetical protein